MLSPEQIAQLRGEAGLPPTPPQPGANDIIAKRKAALGLDQPAFNPIESVGNFAKSVVNPNLVQKNESEPGIISKYLYNVGENVVNNVKQAGDVLKEGIKPTGGNPLATSLEAVGDIAKATMAPTVVPIDMAMKAISNKLSDIPAIQKLATSKAGDKINQLEQSVSDEYNKIAQNHPDLVRSAEGAGNIVLALLNAKATSDLVGGVQKVASKTMGNTSASNTSATLADMGATVKSALPKLGESPESSLLKLQETISPKLTSKQIKMAQSEGRLVSGKEPTIFKSGTPDTVLPSDKIVRASETIQREIPDASKLKQPELYTALEARTSDMAQKLKPKMREVPITTETVQKITDGWEKLKKTQRENAYIPSDVNVSKLQADFESRLKKSKSGTMDDLWETRKAYDNSVPANVKNATAQSSESLQAKKEIWLQNRAILNDAINDTGLGLGKESQQAFSDMTDMYSAKENLLSKASVSLEANPSKVVEWMKRHPYITGSIIGTAAGVTGIPQKAVRVVTGGGF